MSNCEKITDPGKECKYSLGMIENMQAVLYYNWEQGEATPNQKFMTEIERYKGRFKMAHAQLKSRDESEANEYGQEYKELVGAKI